MSVVTSSNRTESMLCDVVEIRRETASLANGIVFKSLPHFSPRIIDVSLIAERRTSAKSPTVCGFQFYHVKYGISKDAREVFSKTVVYFSKNEF
ncbi:hypothetical protein CEXT_374091 [Caerostris extrusa]|uniref:Uncharacterized protein n=1 Tax=Caerostris extrusa TaxID=172846 RepID=A0AAV4YAH9_CAEEX|nr:hypothetical protein CEXT_374091 [Caerostris extrusa]